MPDGQRHHPPAPQEQPGEHEPGQEGAHDAEDHRPGIKGGEGDVLDGEEGGGGDHGPGLPQDPGQAGLEVAAVERLLGQPDGHRHDRDADQGDPQGHRLVRRRRHRPPIGDQAGDEGGGEPGEHDDEPAEQTPGDVASPHGPQQVGQSSSLGAQEAVDQEERDDVDRDDENVHPQQRAARRRERDTEDDEEAGARTHGRGEPGPGGGCDGGRGVDEGRPDGGCGYWIRGVAHAQNV